MKIIKITFLQTFMYNESFMYKIYLQDPDNSNQSIACLTHDSNEALDILVGYRNKIMEKNYKWITDFISILIPTNDEDHVYVSQLLQAKGIVMGIEAQRRAKPYNMGTLYWQLNDCWPAISWSSIDYFGNWKALQYKAKKAFENVLISYQEDTSNISIHIVNFFALRKQTSANPFLISQTLKRR